MKKEYEKVNMTKLKTSTNSLAAVSAAVSPVIISQKIEIAEKKSQYANPYAKKYKNDIFLLAAGGGGGYRIDNKVLC